MADMTANDLALLRARMNAARLSAAQTHKTIANSDHYSKGDLLPFLDTCARELEEAAQLMRAAADAAAHPVRIDCSG